MPVLCSYYSVEDGIFVAILYCVCIYTVYCLTVDFVVE